MQTDNGRKACYVIFNYKHIHTHTYIETQKQTCSHKYKKTPAHKQAHIQNHTHTSKQTHSYILSQHRISESWRTRTNARTRNLLIFARVHVPVTLIMNYAITPQLALSPGVLAESLIASFIVRWLSVLTMVIALTF